MTTTALRKMTAEEKQNLATPADFWAVVDAEFHFQIDVCATEANTKCAWYRIGPDVITEPDALADGAIWIGAFADEFDGGTLRAWCNPPFRNVMAWHRKAHAEAQKHPSAVVAVLGLPGCSQEWFKFAYWHASEIRLLTPRIQFDVPEGCIKESNPRDSVLYIYRRKTINAPATIVPWQWKA